MTRQPAVSREATATERRRKKIKNSLLTAAVATALLSLAACGAQSQTPQVDNASETITVYRDGDPGGNDSQDSAVSEGGVIVEDNDSRDDIYDRDAEDNMQAGQQLPADFPIPVPDDYQVQAVGDVGNETSAVLRVPSGEDAYNYYRQTLADEGFRVVDEGRNQGGYFEAELEFSNNNLEGGMDFDADTVEIDIERYA